MTYRRPSRPNFTFWWEKTTQNKASSSTIWSTNSSRDTMECILRGLYKIYFSIFLLDENTFFVKKNLCTSHFFHLRDTDNRPKIRQQLVSMSQIPLNQRGLGELMTQLNTKVFLERIDGYFGVEFGPESSKIREKKT